MLGAGRAARLQLVRQHREGRMPALRRSAERVSDGRLVARRGAMKRRWVEPEPPEVKRLNKAATRFFAHHDKPNARQKFIDRKRRERNARPHARVYRVR